MRTYTPVINIQKCAAGETPADYSPGDFILIHSDGFFDKLIQFGQSLRFRGADSKFALWNHAALITGQDEIVEAISKGVRVKPLSYYLNKDYILIRIDATDDDRQEAVAFARYCVGDKYGWLTIISSALSFLIGLRLSFGFYGQEICSGLVARSLERTKAIFHKDAAHITPADLAQLYASSWQ